MVDVVIDVDVFVVVFVVVVVVVYVVVDVDAVFDVDVVCVEGGYLQLRTAPSGFNNKYRIPGTVQRYTCRYFLRCIFQQQGCKFIF